MNIVIVLIAGGSGSGKSTLALNICRRLSGQAVLLSLDNYYYDQSEKSVVERKSINYDSPDAIDIDLLCDNLNELQRGNIIYEPIYDFNTHTRKHKFNEIHPHSIVLVEGIMALQFQKLCDVATVKLFVDVNNDERMIRRLLRDVNERNRSVESVIEQYRATVKPMHDMIVEPTKKNADFIIQEGMNVNVVDLLSELFLSLSKSKKKDSR